VTVSTPAVTARDVETYDRDGVVCLRGVFAPHWLDVLAAGIEQDIRAPGPLHTVQQSASEPGFFLTDFCMAQRIAEFREFLFDSPAAEVAARVMGSRRSNFFYDAIWVKEPGTPKRTRWHQDQPFYPIDGRQMSVCWTPLDRVTTDTCLELIRGSHRWQRWFQPELTRTGRDLYAVDSRYERMPDIEADRGAYDIVAFDMEPGDCIVFHGLTVHGAPGNARLDRRRRALSVIWLGDDAVFAARPGPVRPLFEGHGLAPGEPVDCAYFPRVWPRAAGSHPSRSARFTDPGFRVSI
jgi:ectoine hydroxylase-related dioxygenase (phytanoyl-CoA dioxygenase family)